MAAVMESKDGLTNSKESLDNVASAAGTEGVGEVKPVKHFNFFLTLGITFSVTAVPIAVGSYLSLVVGLGGMPFYLYSFIFAGTFQFVTCLSIAELASGIPHSSGMAYWVKVLSPPRWSALFEYVVGWWSNVAWLCIVAASNLYAAQYITALANAVHEDYHPEAWHTYLVCVGISLVSLFLNLPGGFKLMPYVTGSAAVSINVTGLFMLIVLLVRANPKQSASFVFTEVVNTSGWESLGVVFFLSILPGMACLGAFDSALHLTDEVDNPSRQIPRVMLSSFGLGAITGIATIVILGFCTIDPVAMASPSGGMPLVQLLIDGLDSMPLVIVTSVMIILVLTIATTNCLTSWSRLYWSFSSSKMIPFHSWTSKLSSKSSLPVNALLVNTLLANLLCAISIGNSTAMNAILGAIKICYNLSYLLTFGLLLAKGRDSSMDPNRWLNLGRWGTTVNVLAIGWCAFALIWVSFPLFLPVTATSMNYTAPVAAGFTLLSGVYWVLVAGKRKLT